MYLVATYHEGRAFIFPPANRKTERNAQSTMVTFPRLTNQAVEEWLVRHNDRSQVTGGFQLALDHAGIWLLEEWLRREAIRAP